MKLILLDTLIISFCCSFAIGQSNSTISGIIRNLKTDSITCYCSKTIKTAIVNGQFEFNLNVAEPTAIWVTDENSSVAVLVEPGDSIYIKADFGSTASKPEISGRGREKSLYMQQYIPVDPQIFLTRLQQARQTGFPLDYLLKVADSIERNLTSLLDSYKTSMGSESYNWLLGDTKGYFMQVKLGIARLAFNLPPGAIMESKADSISDASKNFLGSYLVFSDDFYRSVFYHNYVVVALSSLSETGQPLESMTLDSKYQYISKLLPPKLFVPAMSELLSSDIDHFKDKQELDLIIRRTFLNPVDSSEKNYLLNKIDDVYLLKEGLPAPDFEIENRYGDKIKLSDFAGKVVYMDFWFDACGPCHSQFNVLEPVKKYFANKKDVIFLNISIDNKLNWQKALKKGNIGGMHVYTQGKGQDHPMIRDYKVYDYPSSRLIDKKGEMSYCFPSQNPDELIRQIERILTSR